MKFQIKSFLTFPILILINISFGIECKKELAALNSHPSQEINEVYSELQKVNQDNKTQLALQTDFDGHIKPEGGGACASATAFNMLQGLRILAQEKPLEPKPVLLEA